MTTQVWVTGPKGYLGSQVCAALEILGCAVVTVDRNQPPRRIVCDAVVHCAGRLRGEGNATRHRMDNVRYTSAVLDAVAPDTLVVMASSRAASDPETDSYARSKAEAELLVGAWGPHLILRLTVLAGPSIVGIGHSFLSKMVEDAILCGSVQLVRHAPPVDLLDVREAAVTMSMAAAKGTSSCEVVEATTGPMQLDLVANLIREHVRRRVGAGVVLTENCVAPESHRPAPASPAQWSDLRALLGCQGIPISDTVRDTVDRVLRDRERDCTQGRCR